MLVSHTSLPGTVINSLCRIINLFTYLLLYCFYEDHFLLPNKYHRTFGRNLKTKTGSFVSILSLPELKVPSISNIKLIVWIPFSVKYTNKVATLFVCVQMKSPSSISTTSPGSTFIFLLSNSIVPCPFTK